MKKAKKPPTLAKRVEVAATLLQKLVRMKAADDQGYLSCVTCGEVMHWTAAQGGHFVPRTCSIHKIREENIHPQCPSCNTYRAEEAKIAYTMYMTLTYGSDFVAELIATKRTPVKRTRFEVEAFISELKSRIIDQEVRLGIRRIGQEAKKSATKSRKMDP